MNPIGYQSLVSDSPDMAFIKTADPPRPVRRQVWILKTNSGNKIQTSVPSLMYLLGGGPKKYQLSYYSKEATIERSNVTP